MNGVDMDRVRLARFIAEKAFKDKKDLGGNPYIGHISRVYGKVSDHMSDDTLQITALLHDLVEDCPRWSFGALQDLFGPEVVEALILLTKSKDEDYMTYIKNIKGNSVATTVKLADLEDNMNVSRLGELNDKGVERLRKYIKAYKILRI